MIANFVLFGAGAAGRYTLTALRKIWLEPLCFTDNDKTKHGSQISGIDVLSPEDALIKYPEATWLATVISATARDIRQQLQVMGVKTTPLWELLPCHHELPTVDTLIYLRRMVSHDALSTRMLNDQIRFRTNPDYDTQESSDKCADIYFPDFIKHLDDEIFIDCGAADGDTVKDFCTRWEKWSSIVAFEPDQQNYNKLIDLRIPAAKITKLRYAVSDFDGYMPFIANGDYSSHLGNGNYLSHLGNGEEKVRVTYLDKILSIVPTYIKMDIEGAELEAIWGARKLIKEHSPVLAICAYHTSDHLWQLPLLIHAINPDYKLFLRRYAEGAWELVWYAVPIRRLPCLL